MQLPVQYTSTCPLHNSFVCLRIVDILKLAPLIGTGNFFLTPSGQPIKRVEVFAIVTEKAVKNDAVNLQLEDGSGSILCIWNLRGIVDHSDQRFKQGQYSKTVEHTTTDTIKKSDISKHLAKFLLEGEKELHPSICIGDFVWGRGFLREFKWKEGVYLCCNQIKPVAEKDVLDQWTAWTNHALDLHQKVYSQKFCMADHLEKISRSLVINDTCQKLNADLERVIAFKVLNPQYPCLRFRGYESLELNPVVEVMKEIFSPEGMLIASKHELTKEEIRKIKYECIMSTLHKFVVDGRLFKKKSSFFERVTGNDQMDALYIITSKCSTLISVASTHQLKNGEFRVENLREAVRETKYHFITNSKHFVAIMTAALQ